MDFRIPKPAKLRNTLLLVIPPLCSRNMFLKNTVAVEVERKKHKLAGAILDVKLITKKKRRPLPINAQCLFLEGIPDGCSSEHVTLFIENRASMEEEPTIQYGEKPGTAICSFSYEIPGNGGGFI